LGGEGDLRKTASGGGEKIKIRERVGGHPLERKICGKGGA